MTPAEIKHSLNKPVTFKEARYGNKHKYILTGATIRLGEEGFYYQAELTDVTFNRSIVICRLEEIEEIKDEHEQSYR